MNLYEHCALIVTSGLLWLMCYLAEHVSDEGFLDRVWHFTHMIRVLSMLIFVVAVFTTWRI